MTKARVGGAELSERNSNYVVAHPGTTAADILHLADQVRRRVQERTGATSNGNCTSGEAMEARSRRHPAATASRTVLVGLLTLVAAAAARVGHRTLGDDARRDIGPRDRYAVRFRGHRVRPAARH